jgi:hypothetical protein
LVPPPSHPSGGGIGQIGRPKSRCSKSPIAGQGRIHLACPRVTPGFESSAALGSTQHRHVCFAWRSTIPPLCHKDPPLASTPCGLFDLQSHVNSSLLRPSPMEGDRFVVESASRPPKCYMSHGDSYVGFSRMVAPTSSSSSTTKSLPSHSPPLGHVQQLLGGGNAPNQVAPSLLGVIRGLLQEKGFTTEAINSVVSLVPSPIRYDNAFRLFWDHCVRHALIPSHCSVEQVAAQLLLFTKEAPHQAKHAYAALLHVPGFSDLRFSPLLRSTKRSWNQSSPKYALLPFGMGVV